MNLTGQHSPNFDERDWHNVDMLVLHYTGMKTAGEAIDRLCDPTSQVSAHYVVNENGKIFNLVPEKKRAWHAGVSYWNGHNNVNQRSIGIEVVNCGHEFGYTPFPEKQMKAVVRLCKDIVTRHHIPAHNVVGHSDVAPTRKQDPGELFDWKLLAENGIGLFPQKPANSKQPAISLKDYGYEISDMPAAITAFQRHFRQSNISGEWDDECAKILAALLAMI